MFYTTRRTGTEKLSTVSSTVHIFKLNHLIWTLCILYEVAVKYDAGQLSTRLHSNGELHLRRMQFAARKAYSTRSRACSFVVCGS